MDKQVDEKETSKTGAEVIIDIDSQGKIVHLRIASQNILTRNNIANILLNIAGKLDDETRRIDETGIWSPKGGKEL